MKFVKRDYDSSYFNTWLERLPLEAYFNKHKVNLIRSVKPSGSLLEFGCGRGRLLNGLKLDYSLSGCDLSYSAITQASKLLKIKNLKVLDIERSHIRKKYDIIIAFDVLEHLKDPGKAIGKISRALEEDGAFIFSVPNRYGIFGTLITSMFNVMDKTHISTLKRRCWIALVRDSGMLPDVRNQHLFGISNKDVAKHFSFNLIVIAKKRGWH